MNIWGFVSVLLLRNKDQERNYALASFAACLCWQTDGVNCALALSVPGASRSRLCPDGPRVQLSGPAYMPSCIRPEHGRRKQGQEEQSPPGCWNYWQKRLFFQFREVKSKFHHFWPPQEKTLGKSWPPTGRNPSDAHGPEVKFPLDQRILCSDCCKKCRLLCQAKVSSLILYCIAARNLWCLRPKVTHLRSMLFKQPDGVNCVVRRVYSGGGVPKQSSAVTGLQMLTVAST